MNELLHGKKNTAQYAQFVDPVTNDLIPFGDEAEFMNSYFCNIFDRLGLDKDIDQDEYRHINSDLDGLYGHIDTNFDLVDELVTTGELGFVIPSIDITKGSSIPGISTFICKDIMRL